MSDLKELTAENGLDETIEKTLTYENSPASMQEEFADGKGGED